MSNSIVSLMETVYQHFLDLYQQSSDDKTPKDIFLSFEPLGRSIDLDSYRLNPSDDTFFPPKATEEVTALTDDIPEIDGDAFFRTDRSVEETYNLILHGAQSGTSDRAETDLFNHLKAGAQQTFEDTKIGKFSQSGIQYRPAYAAPQDWYNPSQTDNWTTYTYQMKIESESSTGKLPRKPVLRPIDGPVKKRPPTFQPERRPWQWHVLSEDLTPVLTRPEIIREVSASPAVIKQIEKAKLSSRIDVKKLSQPSTSSTRPTIPFNKPRSRSVLSNKSVFNPTISKRLSVRNTQLSTQQKAKQQVVSSVVLDKIRQQVVAPSVSISPVSETDSRRRLAQAATREVLLENARSESVKSTEMKVSFQYCIVTVDRPWFRHTLLQMKNWYIPGYEAGDFSDGAIGNNGLFSALPISFIVVKDLAISGWSQSEHKQVMDSVSFGPFSLLNRKIEGTSLTQNGLQVIGWISQVMPEMPPLSDPVTD